MLAVDTAVGVEFVVPGWMLIATAAVTLIVTAYAAAKIIQTVVVKPSARAISYSATSIASLRDEVKSWMETTDLVSERGPKWDHGLNELAKAVSALENVQRDIALIKEQVTIDHGHSMKDRIIALSDSHEDRIDEVDRRLNRLDSTLRRQDSRSAEAQDDLGDHLDRQDATRAGEADELDDHLDRQDDRHDATHPKD